MFPHPIPHPQLLRLSPSDEISLHLRPPTHYRQPSPEDVSEPPTVNLDDDEPSARLFGEILGLSTGMKARAVVPVMKEDFLRAKRMSDLVFSRGESVTEAFMAEFQALYLPSFFRTFYQNSIGDFNAVDPRLFGYYCELVERTATSSYLARFVRKRWDEFQDIQISVGFRFRRISKWREEIRRPIHISLLPILTMDIDFGPSMEYLKSSCSPKEFAIMAHLVARDPMGRAALRACRRGLERVEDECWMDDGRRVGCAEGRGRVVKDSAARFEECAVNEGKVRCRVKELRACSRCKVVRFCSEEHQALHWKDHQRVCFAPTW